MLINGPDRVIMPNLPHPCFQMSESKVSAESFYLSLGKILECLSPL